MKFFNPDRSNVPQSSSHRPSSHHISPPPPPQPQQQPQQRPQPQSSSTTMSPPTTMSSPTSKSNTKFLSFLLKAIIMVLFISLFFLFVGIASVLLLHLCIAGRGLRRHRRSTLQTDFPSGLSLKDLQKLPCFDYGGGVGPAAPADCVICLEGFRDRERCRVLPHCRHVFHSRCVDEWLVKSPACPICRSAVAGAVCSRQQILNTEEIISV